jgi:hypothetical protein
MIPHFNVRRAACLTTLLALAGTPALGAEMKHATAKFEVKDYKEQAYEIFKDGTGLYELTIQEQFTGDIEATGSVRFLQARLADGASFVGIESVTGSIGGRKGSFLLQDSGTLKGNGVNGKWFVVPGSGTGELKGLRGEGGFTAKLGQHADVTLDYSFE